MSESNLFENYTCDLQENRVELINIYIKHFALLLFIFVFSKDYYICTEIFKLKI